MSTHSYAESINLSIKRFAKLTNETPKRMQPTTRSFILFAFVCIIGVIEAITYFRWRHIPYLFYPISILWFKICAITAYYEIDPIAFKRSILSFRGLFIVIPIILNSILNQCTIYLCPECVKSTFFNTFFCNIAWFLSVMMGMSADSAPRIINFIRFFGPIFVMAQTVLTIIEPLQNEHDYVFFSILHGSVTLSQMKIALRSQTLWYGITFVWGVPLDYKHEYFVLLERKVKAKTLLPTRNIATQMTSLFNGKICFKTDYLFHLFTICTFVYTVLYIGVLTFSSYDDTPISFFVVSFLLMVVVIFVVVVLFFKYFQWHMIKELVLQFRVNLVFISLLILLYCAVQKIVWADQIEPRFVLTLMFNSTSFTTACLVCLARDGMNVLYPKSFVIFFSVLLSAVSMWNIFLLTFSDYVNEYPEWFLLLEKEAYVQVSVINALSLYYLWSDPEQIYFVLIRKRIKTKEIWGDKNKERGKSIASDQTIAPNSSLQSDDRLAITMN